MSPAGTVRRASSPSWRRDLVLRFVRFSRIRRWPPFLFLSPLRFAPWKWLVVAFFVVRLWREDIYVYIWCGRNGCVCDSVSEFCVCVGEVCFLFLGIVFALGEREREGWRDRERNRRFVLVAGVLGCHFDCFTLPVFGTRVAPDPGHWEPDPGEVVLKSGVVIYRCLE